MRRTLRQSAAANKPYSMRPAAQVKAHAAQHCLGFKDSSHRLVSTQKTTPTRKRSAYPSKVEVLGQHVGHMPLVLMPVVIRSLVRVALPHQLPEVTKTRWDSRLLQPWTLSMHDTHMTHDITHNIQCCCAWVGRHKQHCFSTCFSVLKHQTSEQTAGDSRKPATHKRLQTYRLFGHHASHMVCHVCPGPRECYTAHCLLLQHQGGAAHTDCPSILPA